MPIISFDQFELGIDRRKGRGVADANRLFDLVNCYVTTGWAIEKRPGLIKVAQLTPGSVGLMAYDGKLNTFSAVADPAHPTASDGVEIDNHQVPYSANAADEVKEQHFSEVFNGSIYVAIEYQSGNVEHHFIDGASPWHITDINCPQTKVGLRLAEKIWATDGDVVAYSATGDPTDWTTVSDAGFLPTGLKTPGTAEALGLGEFNKSLAVLMADAVQVWAVDPDPAQNALDKVIPNVGTRYPLSIKPVSDDLFFLAPPGYRSVALQKFTNNMVELDVGTPIDALVVPLLTDSLNPRATYYSGRGQYWNSLGDNNVHVYSFSRSAKVSAWSRYAYPFNFEYHAALGDQLYVRSGNSIYKVDPAAFDDEGQSFEVLIDFSFQNLKRPGVLKQITAVDLVAEGSGEIAHRYVEGIDPVTGEQLIGTTAWVPFAGDTRSQPLIPVEVCATEIAPVIRHNGNSAFRFDELSYHYENLGPL